MLTNVEMTTEQAYSLSTSECSEDLLKTETFTDNFLSFEDVGKCENFMDNDPLNFDCSDEVNKCNVILNGLESINCNTDLIMTFVVDFYFF